MLVLGLLHGVGPLEVLAPELVERKAESRTTGSVGCGVRIHGRSFARSRKAEAHENGKKKGRAHLAPCELFGTPGWGGTNSICCGLIVGWPQPPLLG